ncbi:MAG: HEAT repeat domain-containing protein, partial [Blastocatellia bacterium]|nr:HEAT repeat domain-containing protein [Blastocatellia bacterium]
MNRIFIAPILLLLSLSSPAVSQTPGSIDVQILKAEDARAYDRTIENLLRHTNPAIRTRAALAAGRIGSEAAVPALLPILEKGTTAKEREMAAFALGEIESIAAADAILKALNEQKAETRAVASVPQAETRASTRVPNETARLVEAAGKIAAANPKDPKSKDLGEAILDTLEAEDRRGAKQSRDVVLIGLTAALRAKPDETNIVVAKFLTNLDARVRADAANTLSRVKAKNANE